MRRILILSLDLTSEKGYSALDQVYDMEFIM